MSFIRGVFALLFSLIVLIFAISNRHAVDVFMTPTGEPLLIPLCIVALAILIIGFLSGATLVWLNESPLRRDRRRSKKKVKHLEKALETVKESNDTAVPSSDFFPALTNGKK